MCGIVGGVARDVAFAAGLARNANAMLQSVAHRGRDGSGLNFFRYEGPERLAVLRNQDEPGINAVLGHIRLAIIDTSAAGLQPMASHDGRHWISYNGEVYNYIELRQELESKGHHFRTGTDTEVILASYREYGMDCVKRLNGMFAFAVLDAAAGKLVLVRDPLGIKPLYYWHEPQRGALVFASEIKGILASGLYSKEPDWSAAYHYFTFLYAPNPSTFFKNIRQLQPAHSLELDLNDGAIRIERYWHPRARPDVARLEGQELDDAMKAMLSDSVAKQMRSDVPIGSFLSSGVDSTIVTGLMTRHSNRVKTYTVSFPEKEYSYFNEGEIAATTARHLGTDHHELPIRLNEPHLIFDLIDHFDQPFGNPTYYLMYLISRQAKEHITVALCGAGGDELYAGYPRHDAMGLAAWTRWIPSPVLHGMARGLRQIPDSYRGAGRRRMQSFFAGLDRDLVKQYMNWTYFFSDAEKSELLRFPEAASEESRHWFRRLYETSVLCDGGNRLLELDIHSFLVDNLLEYTDKMSMAVALEMRVPILDHEFVEFSLNVPFRAKLKRGESKLPLRRAFRDFFTPQARVAPKKGFVLPVAQWMRDSFDTYFEGHQGLPPGSKMSGPTGSTWKSGLLDKAVIDRYRAEHRRGIQDRGHELFGIMIYDLWYSQHFA